MTALARLPHLRGPPSEDQAAPAAIGTAVSDEGHMMRALNHINRANTELAIPHHGCESRAETRTR